MKIILEITIVGREIKQIKVANPTSDTTKVMIVYDKDNGIAMDTPTIEFEYSGNDKSLDFPMSSFQNHSRHHAKAEIQYRLTNNTKVMCGNRNVLFDRNMD